MLKKGKKKRFNFIKKFKLFFRGLGESFSVDAKGMKTKYDTVIMVLFFGDLMGIPFLKTFYSVDVFPYFLKEIKL